MQVAVCGIAGGSGAGKTTLARAVVAQLARTGCDAAVLPFDEYYRDHSHLSPDERATVNYDHPDALDHELFVAHLHALTEGRAVDIPEYDFATHSRTGATRRVEPGPIVVAEGILLFAVPAIQPLLDHRVFVRAPAGDRLARRIERDVRERGRTADGVRAQFAATVAPMHDRFVEPGADIADEVVDGFGDMGSVARRIADRLTG